jgi:hypothetical protein
MNGIPHTSLLARHIIALVDHTSVAFSTQLDMFKATSSWMATLRLVSWMRDLPKQISYIQPGYHSLEPMLDSWFPEWRSFAQWRPNRHDLAIFEQKLSNSDHLVLQDILTLEGPCFWDSKFSTLREAYIVQILETKSPYLRHHSLNINFSSRDSLHVTSILDLLNSTLRTASVAKTSTDDSKLQLYKQICTGKVIEDWGLQILEYCFAIDQSMLTGSTAEFLRHRAEQTEPPASVFLELVDALTTFPNDDLERSPHWKLRELLKPGVLDTAMTTFNARRLAIRSTVNVDRAWGKQDFSMFEELHTFGATLLKAEWLMDSLDTELRSTILQWPSLLEILECHAIHTFSFSQNGITPAIFTTKLAGYMIERLVQPGTLNASEIRAVETVMVFWRKHPDQDRRMLGLTLAEQGLEHDLDYQCMIEQLPSTEGFLITTLLKILRAESINPEDGCIALAQSLTSTHHGDTINCFRSILLAMMESQGDSLMNYALQNLGVVAFMQWMENLEVIFDDNFTQDTTTKTQFLTQDFLNWTRRLWQDLDTLKNLEATKSTRFGPAMQCLIRGGSQELQHDLIRILQFLSSTFDESRRKALCLVTSQLHQDGDNSSLITKSMTHIVSATPTGAEACIEVLETYEEAPMGVAEVILGAWHSSPDLMPNDTVALEMIAEVLGFDATELEIPSVENLQAADKYFEEQYKVLLDEAVSTIFSLHILPIISI